MRDVIKRSEKGDGYFDKFFNPQELTWFVEFGATSPAAEQVGEFLFRLSAQYGKHDFLTQLVRGGYIALPGKGATYIYDTGLGRSAPITLKKTLYDEEGERVLESVIRGIPDLRDDILVAASKIEGYRDWVTKQRRNPATGFPGVARAGAGVGAGESYAVAVPSPVPPFPKKKKSEALFEMDSDVLRSVLGPLADAIDGRRNHEVNRLVSEYRVSGNACKEYAAGMVLIDSDDPGDCSAAFKLLDDAASKGLKYAGVEVAHCLLYGVGTRKGQHEAYGKLLGLKRRLLESRKKNRLRSVIGDESSVSPIEARVHYLLGVCLYNGWGIKKNYSDAADSFYRGAKGGLPDALYAYGMCLMRGDGVVSRSVGRGFEAIQEAAHQGHEEAQGVVREKSKCCGTLRVHRRALTTKTALLLTLKFFAGRAVGAALV